MEVAEEGSFQDSFEQRACADCHAEADLYHYTNAHEEGWYSYYPPEWAYYYDTPWWYDDYWYYPPPPPPVPGEPEDVEGRTGRTVWTRPSGGGPGWLPSQGSPKDQNLGAHPDTTKPTDTRNDGNGSNDQNNEKDEKDKKAKRRLWRR
jgi:hypothetical protein